MGITLSLWGLIHVQQAWQARCDLFGIGLGVFGIFGYHACLFSAYRLAPAGAVNLLNYLWPSLIAVLGPPILKSPRLNLYQGLGTGMALMGALLIASRGEFAGGSSHSWGIWLGYGLAVSAALCWAFYSVLLKKFPARLEGAIHAACLLSGLLALAVQFWMVGFHGVENEIAQFDRMTWGGLVYLGLGPLGVAFLLWEKAVQLNDSHRLALLSYLTPVLSVTWMSAFGFVDWTLSFGLGALAILGGSLVAHFGEARKLT
jgi:drug/metabolite transporter (DMT)-like permease